MPRPQNFVTARDTHVQYAINRGRWLHVSPSVMDIIHILSRWPLMIWHQHRHRCAWLPCWSAWRLNFLDISSESYLRKPFITWIFLTVNFTTLCFQNNSSCSYYPPNPMIPPTSYLATFIPSRRRQGLMYPDPLTLNLLPSTLPQRLETDLPSTSFLFSVESRNGYHSEGIDDM